MTTNSKIFGMIMAGTMVLIAAQVDAVSADAVKGKATFADSCIFSTLSCNGCR